MTDKEKLIAAAWLRELSEKLQKFPGTASSRWPGTLNNLAFKLESETIPF